MSETTAVMLSELALLLSATICCACCARSPNIRTTGCATIWQPNDLGTWDNRCIMHIATPNFTSHSRMHRITVLGDQPYHEGGMKLTPDEQAMADGRRGPVLEFAIGLLAKAGALHGAERFQPIAAAYVNTTFAAIQPHHDFLKWVADEGTEVAVPTCTNVGVHDPDNPLLRRDEEGLRDSTRSRALRDLHAKVGCKLAMTCAPYQLPGAPGFGAQIAVSESNAVSYFNSVVGARTLKYGDYIDLCAGLTGRVPLCGLHTDEGRLATLHLEVATLPEALAADDLSYHLIGHAMGRKVGMKIPVLTGVNPAATPENLRGISATGASAGGVAMYHAVGLTPEAPTLDAATGGREVEQGAITVDDVIASRNEMTGFTKGPIDAVVIGTPHVPLNEVERLAGLIDGRRVKNDMPFYIQMNRFVLECAREQGWIDTIVAAGVTPVVDTCLYWRPVAHGLVGRVMTNSGKYAYYAPGELPVETAIASLDECVESAVRGEVWRNPDLELAA
ncbi:MAG: DUF521 domain-containing protein [Rhodospirillales bacterium]|nr:DUF521 domain-containing protein [Rhodospirillales bacterium]